MALDTFRAASVSERLRIHGETILGNAEKICVIFNPSAGRARARRRMKKLREALQTQADFWPTQRPGHAEELAAAAVQAGFPVVAAAGGDGTVHEVANGLLHAAHPEVLFAVFPLGSANDYAHSLEAGGWRLEAGGRTFGLQPTAYSLQPVDVGLVRAEDGRERYFVNTLGLGFSGAVALESRRVRYLQGVALYGLAFLRALCFRYACPRMTCTFDGETRVVPTLSLTVALGRKEGGFVVAPEARLDDGLFDYLHVGCLSRWEVLRYLPRLASGRLLPPHPALHQGRCREVRLASESPLTVHLDGEFFCRPEDGVRELGVRMLPGKLKVLSSEY